MMLQMQHHLYLLYEGGTLLLEKVLRNKKLIVAFILPSFILYTTLMIYPMCKSVYFTFFEGIPNQNFNFVGIRNYQALFHDPYYLNSVVVTFKFLLIVATGSLVFGFLCALLLKYGIRKGVNFCRTILYMPVIIPSVAVSAMFVKIYEVTPNYGLLNSLLSVVGLEEVVRSWIGDPATAFGSFCFVELWRAVGYYMVLFFAGLVSVPADTEEAARIDGANSIQMVWRVVLPQIKPVTFMCVVLAIRNFFMVYDIPSVMTKGGPGQITQVMSLYMYKIAFKSFKYGYGSTLAVTMLIFIIILTQVVIIIEKRGEKND